jgi:hypothetical protein
LDEILDYFLNLHLLSVSTSTQEFRSLAYLSLSSGHALCACCGLEPRAPSLGCLWVLTPLLEALLVSSGPGQLSSPASNSTHTRQPFAWLQSHPCHKCSVSMRYLHPLKEFFKPSLAHPLREMAIFLLQALVASHG